MKNINDDIKIVAYYDNDKKWISSDILFKKFLNYLREISTLEDSVLNITITEKSDNSFISSTDGTSGLDGTSGTSGTSGFSGIDGTSGLDGTSGTSGFSGIDGTSGLDGISGTSGTSGTSGFSGIDGTSGTSGIDGKSAYNLAGSKDNQILVWSGDSWKLNDKMILPGSFTFEPSKGVIRYETIEDGYYEMVFFGSDDMSGMTNLSKGEMLFFDGADWINTTGLKYDNNILNLSNLRITDKLNFNNKIFDSNNKISSIMVKNDSGDPLDINVNFCINIYDKNLKIYADGAWRTITSW